jgi:hypothetical protein
MVHLSIQYKHSDQPPRHRLEHPLLDVLESELAMGSVARAAKRIVYSYLMARGNQQVRI